MALGLVARSARALSDHLNAYFRVLKGIDQDSVALRLNTGGFFQVRHSVTAAPLLTVTDAGLGLPTGAITSAMIADGTIVGADIAPNTITSDKLFSGIGVPAGSITSNEIANGTIATVDIQGGAVSQFITRSGLGGSTQTAGAWGNIPASDVILTTVGGYVLVAGFGSSFNNTASALTQFQLVMDGVAIGVVQNVVTGAANQRLPFALVAAVQPASPGAHTFTIQWQVVSGSTQETLDSSFTSAIELKK